MQCCSLLDEYTDYLAFCDSCDRFRHWDLDRSISAEAQQRPSRLSHCFSASDTVVIVQIVSEHGEEERDWYVGLDVSLSAHYVVYIRACES